MAPYRGVIFDLDGTLIDSFEPIATAVNAAREEVGMPPVPALAVRRHVGRGLEALIADLVSPRLVEQGVRRFRDTYARIFLEGTRTIDGAAEAVRELAGAGIRLAVASNKPARFSRPIVRQAGLESEIGIVLGPDDRIPAKPEPAMLNEARGRLGIPRSECVYVGDMPLDVESARRAGLDHLLVPTGSFTARELLDVPGTRVIPQLNCLHMFTAA
ncbi:MAG: HAD-IA family hydrolase [Acidobacteriota bacterium]|nr:HAD-IA family hydrolase [Acidobacteriota bacterium]